MKISALDFDFKTNHAQLVRSWPLKPKPALIFTLILARGNLYLKRQLKTFRKSSKANFQFFFECL